LSVVVEARAGQPRLDLSRNVHAVLGLPFDAMDLAQAVQQLRDAARERRRCVLTTPNLNFAVAVRSDAAFRSSVLRSQLCVADGMPIVWLARLLGAPLAQRVAGSDLFEALKQPSPQAPSSARLQVFFFGGPDGAAQAAAEALRARGGLLDAVGHDAPGFVSVEAMSEPERIARINASGADFVVVALGARKGQQWIEHNLERLQAPLLSHLGAVVNFAAGTVSRAPRWMQRTGLEWLWRIRAEPELWRRYWSDGSAFLRILATEVLPWWVLQRWQGQGEAPTHSVDRGADSDLFRLIGDWRSAPLAPLRADLAAALGAGRVVHVDLNAVAGLDSALVGLLLLVEGWQQPQRLVLPVQAGRKALQRALAAFGVKDWAA
jgi:N-acetylglucosaminyldiphosphoundecaprenol N-acetyl-beta-D-mannosaminyltransferase